METELSISEATAHAVGHKGHSVAHARRHAQLESLGAAFVLSLATVLFGMVTSGRFTNYLQPWFKPYLLAACAMMAFLAIWTLLTASDSLDAALDGETESPDAVSAGHNHGWPRIGALMLVPALTFALAAPAALNTDAALKQDEIGNRRLANREPIDFDPLSAQGLNELTVQDYSERFVLGRPEELVDRRVRMLGFVARPDALPDGQWTVNRFRIYCCAADANLYSVAIDGVEQPEGENVWVEVEGFINLDKSKDRPVLDIVDIQIVDEPAEPYL